MRAVIQPRYGDANVLELVQLADPPVGDDDVRVRVHAASLNFADRMILLGRPWLFRPLYGFPRPRNRIAGHDMAGVVDAVGSAVTRFAPGDRVFGEMSGGSCAELVLAKEAQLTKLPEDLSFEQAATLPMAGTTALQGLRDAAAVNPGQRVLVNGASGGVGTMAVQIARALGADVTAVCSTRNVEQARHLGADEVIDYTRQDYTNEGPRYDVVFDLVGNHSLRQRRSVLKPGGIYVASFGQGGSRWLGPLGRILRVAISAMFSSQLVVLTVTTNVESDLAELARLVQSGALKPAIAQTFSLEDAADAFRVLLGGHVRGKLVIHVA